MKSRLYKVKEGDKLWKIAMKFNVTLIDLIKWNNLPNCDVHVGQVLLIG